MSELIANRYRLDRPLDVGSAAFQAFDLQLSRTVVVKTLPSDRAEEARLARQFYQEAKAAARLTHPNLVAIYDVSEVGAHGSAGKPNGLDPFIVFEWVPGCDLLAYLGRREPLTSEEVADPFERKLDLLIQVCRGLHYGHERGLTHGSLNPENIRITAVPEAKVLNFGITPLRETASWKYLSPEQLQGQTKPDPRSDLFSLGVILYEILLGVHPFEGETEEATGMRILTSEYRPVDDLLPGAARQLTDIVNGTLAPSPDDRFSDCRLLESELRSLRSRLGAEREECRARLVSLRASLKRDSRSQQPGQARLFDLSVLESADPSSEEYEKLLRSCNELSVVIDRLKSGPQIQTLLDSAEAEANAGELEAALALLADLLRKDPGNTRAQSLEAVVRRRKEVRSLLQEARQAEAADDAAMGCILALQAVELDPSAYEAKAEFERMQAVLGQRREQAALAPLAPSDVQTAENPGAPMSALALEQPRTRLLGRPLIRVVPVLGLLLLLGFVWVMLTRHSSGPSVRAGRTPAEATPSEAKAQALAQAIVSLDVVPWAKVDSIIDLKDGKAVAHGELASPCTFRLPPGRYAMTVSHPDFGSSLLRVDVRDGINRVNASLLSEPQLEKEVQRRGR